MYLYERQTAHLQTGFFLVLVFTCAASGPKKLFFALIENPSENTLYVALYCRYIFSYYGPVGCEESHNKFLLKVCVGSTVTAFF